MQFKSQLALALVVTATGCASHHDKIVFSDEAEIRAQAAAATQVAVEKRLAPADEAQIEQLVLGYLLERHFWDLAGYSAVFLQADDAEVAALMKQYPAHVPPIKSAKHAELRSHRPPLDKDTKKPAIVLTSEVNAPNADDSVDAIGRWFAGDAVTGFRAIRFKKTDGVWRLVEVK